MNAINVVRFLNTGTKFQLVFSRIQDRAKLVFQDRKYIVKYGLIKDVKGKENYMLGRVSYFKDIFQHIFV